jgi:hypothetical protein
MKRFCVLSVVLAAMVTLGSAAAGSPAAPKQHVALELTFYPGQTFLVLPRSGVLKPDSGRIAQIPESEGRKVVRDGQELTIYSPTWVLKGKKGTLTIRERNEWVFLGSDANGDGIEDAVAVGTWKVVRGSGQYAGLTGGGRSAHAGLGHAWNARYDGFVTTR